MLTDPLFISGAAAEQVIRFPTIARLIISKTLIILTKEFAPAILFGALVLLLVPMNVLLPVNMNIGILGIQFNIDNAVIGMQILV